MSYKILWFTNTSVNYKNQTVGSGWISSLELNIKKEVDLHIAYISKDIDKPFDFNGTKYWPIKLNRWERFTIERFTSSLNKKLIKKCKTIVDQISPDIVHVHGTEKPFGLIAKETDIPVVVSAQGILTSIVKVFFKGIKPLIILFNSKSSHFITGKSYFHRYLSFVRSAKIEREILKHIKYSIGRTEWDKSVYRILAPKSTYFHCDEILRPKFYNNKWQPNFRKGELILITTMRPTIYKGLETICKSLSFLKKCYNVKYTLKIAGISENDQLLKFVNRATNLKSIKEDIKLLGSLNEEQLLEELLSANVFINASHIENSPNGLCEAMILGMPCISSYVGGVPSLINNQSEGLLFNSGDALSLAGILIQVWEDKELAIRLGSNARETAMKRHNPKRITSDLLRIYNQIIEEKLT